ncbi:MAG: hypothetical protein JW724_07180 [Candidatus Altiarchaeota archaeon]|nr:hypothetical protein [Candidatus Altiarchaeota archaeon]
MMKRLAIVILCMAALANVACAAITLGSITDVKFLNLQKGDIGEFKASFFSLGDEPLDLEFEIEYPKELRQEIYPQKLTIYPGITDTSNCDDCEYFILRDGRTYVKTYPVYVYIKIPSEISRNLYEIRLIATARTKEGSSASGIKQSMAQVREVVFNAYVPGSLKEKSFLETENVVSNGSDYDADEELRLEYRSRASSGESNEETRGREQSTSAVSGSAVSESGETVKDGDRSYSGGDSGAGTGEDNPTSTGTGLIERDSSGKTKINLPTGNVVLSREESETAIDIGIITLTISVASLLVKVLKS